MVDGRCVYQDVDGQDLEGDTCHLIAWDGDRLAGLPAPARPANAGRRCGHRPGDQQRLIIAGQGLGHELIAQALKQAQKRLAGYADLPVRPRHICQGYYGRYGFEVGLGEEYLEDGISTHRYAAALRNISQSRLAPQKATRLLSGAACRDGVSYRRHKNQGYSNTALICRRFRSIHRDQSPPAGESDSAPAWLRAPSSLFEFADDVQVGQRGDSVLGYAPGHAGGFHQGRSRTLRRRPGYR